MKKLIISIIILFVALTFSSAVGYSETQDFINAINEARTANGLQGLEPDPYLTMIAQERSEDMASNHYFAHLSKSLLKEIKRSIREQDGTNGIIYIGEVLARGDTGITIIRHINAWLASPSHKNCILDKKYGFTKIGVGISVKDGKKFITILFSNR
jgi:uncharacterized protein YkwD